MPIGLAEFETALGEHLAEAVGPDVPVFSEFIRRDDVSIGVCFRESGSTNFFDLEGAIELALQTYEIIVVQRGEMHEAGEPAVDAKNVAQCIINSLNGLRSQQQIGTTYRVIVDSMLCVAQTARITDDAGKGGPQIAIPITLAANFYTG